MCSHKAIDLTQQRALILGVSKSACRGRDVAYDPSRLCRNRRSDCVDRVGRGGLGPARQVMIRAAEYKENARECRELATRMLRPEDRDALERIAQIWERLAMVPERPPDPVQRCACKMK